MRVRRALALTVAAALAAAACGGDDDDDAGATTTTSGTTAGSGAAATTLVEPAATTEVTAPLAAGTGIITGSVVGAGGCTLAEPLRIGYAADFSDLGAFADVPGSRAAQVEVDLVNQEGGVGGRPVEYVVKALPADPSGVQRAAQEMLDDGVNAIIGPPFAAAGVPLIDAIGGQVPIISNASTDLANVDPNRGAFLISFSDPVQGAAAAEFAIANGATTAVTFSSPDDPYFTNTTAAFTETFTQQDGTVLQDFTFGLADDDFSSQVNELANLNERPDVLYTAMGMPSAGVLLQQLDAAGLGDVKVIGADSFDATVVWSAGGVANGVSFTAHTYPTEDNGVQAFLDAAAAAGVEIETISFGALASDVVRVFAHVAEQACSVEGAALIDAIKSIRDLEVTTGQVTYAGTNGVPEKDVVILTVENGAPTFTQTFRPN